MHKNTLVKVIAIILWLVALLFVILAIAAALGLSGSGLGAGWGQGSRLWLIGPVMAAPLLIALGLFVLGTILYFLARIDENMYQLRLEREENLRKAKEAEAAARKAAEKQAAELAAAKAAAQKAAAEKAAAEKALAERIAAETTVVTEQVAPPKPRTRSKKQAAEAAAVVAAVAAVDAAGPAEPVVAWEAAAPVVAERAVVVIPETPAAERIDVEVIVPQAEAATPEEIREKIDAALADLELPTAEEIRTKIETALIGEPEVGVAAAAVGAAALATADDEIAAVRLPQLEIEVIEPEPPVAKPARKSRAAKAPAPAPEPVPTAPAEREELLEAFTSLEAQIGSLQARLAELQATTEVEAGAISATEATRLPGAEEAARIATEMAIARSAATKTAQRAVASGAEDDLLLIVGIGPTYAVRLRELGITTFAALAKSSDEILVEVTGGNVERAIREDWRGQARQLARAKSKGKSAPAG